MPVSTKDPFSNCRGDETKRKLCSQFTITVIAHLALLPGQTKSGCCGPLTAQYYLFSYVKKNDDKDTGSFFAGDHCAKAFLELIRADPLPLFNPVLQETGEPVPDTSSSSIGSIAKRIVRHPLNKELFNAVNLLCAIWNSPPRSALANILRELNDGSEKCPPDSAIKAVNTIVGRDQKNRTLRQMINEISQIRKFSFDQIAQVLSRLKIINNIDPSAPPESQP